MPEGKVTHVDDRGGTIARKGKRFRFDQDDLGPGFSPRVGDEVAYDRDGERARAVRPPGAPSPAPPPDRRPPAPPSAGPQGAGGRPARPSRPGRPGGGRDRSQPRRREASTRGQAGSPPTTPFVNPYNFVPLHPAGVRREPLDLSPRYTIPGLVRLEVEITLDTVASVSPVRAGTDRDGIPVWRARRDRDSRPWVPGTSLKGPLRAVAEALSNSCLPELQAGDSFTWRAPAPVQAGFLVRTSDGWHVERAQAIKRKPERPVRGGDPASGRYHTKSHRHDDRGAATYNGVWVIADVPTAEGDEQVKRWQHVFERGTGRARVPDEVVRAADAAYARQYEEDSGRGSLIAVELDGVISHREPRTPYRSMRAGDRRPVWYRSAPGQVVAIGPTGVLRRQFTGGDGEPVTLGRMLDRHTPGGDASRSFHSCAELEPGADGRPLVCLACRLFGTTLPHVGVASGWQGLVRVGPASSAAPLPERAPVILQPLGQPKPSAQTFYLWNPSGPASYLQASSRLRGRKHYWHRRGTTDRDVRIDDGQLDRIRERGAAAEQLRAVELLPTGTRFTFEVDAELGDPADLGLLVATIEPSRLARVLGATRRDLRHKLGGGKPLGMGSASLRIVAATVADPAQRYSSPLAAGDERLRGEVLGERLDAWVRAAAERHDLRTGRADLEALLALLDWEAVAPELLTYPPGDEGAEWEHFRWFTKHAFTGPDGRPGPGRGGALPQPLPTAMDTAKGRDSLLYRAPGGSGRT